MVSAVERDELGDYFGGDCRVESGYGGFEVGVEFWGSL